MTETKSSSLRVSKSYFRYLVFVLILIEILDAYTTAYPLVIPSNIIDEFLADMNRNTAQGIFAIGAGIATIGMYFVFINQYFADKFGRKIILAFTCFGMAFASLMMILSTNFVMFVIFLFLLYLFFSSDIWMIYINEECPDDKRAIWANIIVSGGIIGVFISSILRGVFITETSPVGAWRGLSWFAVILGFLCAILVFFTLKETSTFLDDKKARIQAAKAKPSFKENVSSLFKSSRRTEYIVILFLALTNGWSYLFCIVGQEYMRTQGGLKETQVNTLVLISAALILAGYITTGITGDKIGRKFVLYLWSILYPIFVIILVVLVTGGLGTSPITWLFFGLIYSAWWGLIGGIRIVTVEIVPTDKRGTAGGLRGFISAAGITSGLLLGGFLTLAFGYGVAFIIFSIPLFINIPLIYKYIKETKGIDLTSIKG
jgi:MFS family permease